MFYQDERGQFRTSGFDEIPWIEYGFGTRAAYEWPQPWKTATLRQTHSSMAIIVREPVSRASAGDALITSTPGLLAGVRTADCLPILLVEEGRKVVAAVHAGWRGTVANVVASTITRMCEEFSADPARIRAAIGPGIGPCCFEVGPEVAILFGELFPERRDFNRRTKVDLAEANRRLLVRAGIPEERISGGAPCTCCHPKEFYSHRRDADDAGRMLSVVGIRP